jgi:hypothetical protein
MIGSIEVQLRSCLYAQRDVLTGREKFPFQSVTVE